MDAMRVIVVGYGVQGRKRLQVAGSDAVGVVDPVAPEAVWRDLRDVPLTAYDGALVCTPDEPKLDILGYLAGHGKHALVEKPLYAPGRGDLVALQDTARRTGAVLYTAYNHRFEPHFVRMRDTISSGVLGRIYSCRMFYGNGTARLVRDSAWRDKGAGVLPDLGSHLLDTLRFWFGDIGDGFVLNSVNRFENAAPDHVIIACETSVPRFELEMTLLSWRNHFTCDIFAEKGSAHISSLCKWGPSVFTLRQRVLPSGRPPEDLVTLIQSDPTWEAEYAHFNALIASGWSTDLGGDIWLNTVLARLGAAAAAGAGK